MLKSIVIQFLDGDFYCTQIDTDIYPTSLLGAILTSEEGFFVCKDTLKSSGHERTLLVRGNTVRNISFDSCLDSRFVVDK